MHRSCLAVFAAITLPAAAATEFEGGNLNAASAWDNGLPVSGNPGTIAADGTNGTTAFSFGSGSMVDQATGTITSADGFNLTGGTWTMSGGRIVTRYFLSNGGATTFNFSGGVIELSDAAGTQYVGTANGGTMHISGSAVVDGSQASADVQSAGTLNVDSNWTGSWTWGTYSGNDWKNLFTSDSDIKLDGASIDGATFDATFLVTNDGKTLEIVVDHPVPRNPVPSDGALGVVAATSLAWTEPTAYVPTGYNVYFGADPDVRANPMTTVATNAFDPPGELAWTTTYHWVVDSLDGATVHAGPPWSFTTEPDPTAPYDPLYDLALHNVHWTSPSSDSAGSMPLGNGDLGMNVWAEANGDLLLLLSKTDTWSDNGRILKLGRVRISMDPNPFAAGEPFLQTLNLPNGEILVTAGPAGNAVQLRIWADANNPAIHVEAEGDSLRIWQAEVEIWRAVDRGFVDATELNSAYGVRSDPTAPRIQPDTVVGGQTDRVTWYHRNTHSIWEDTLNVQSLPHLTDLLTDPLLDRTFGATLYADGGFSNASDTTLVSDAPTTGARFTIVALTGITPTAADWLGALAAEKAVVETTPLAERYAAHVDWWQNFWLRHWLVVETPGAGVTPGSDPFQVTQGYLLQRFINACGGRGGSPIKFNGSIFTVDATAAYDPDYRKWGPCFWWQNTRLPYWAMPMAGDLELMEPLFNMYLDALPLARERVHTYYGHPGAYFPEVIYFWGTWNNDNYGWDRTGKEVGRSDNEFIRWEWQGGLELLWMMLTRYHAAPDDAFATDTLVPLAVDLIDLYDHRFPRDPDGTIRFTPSQALETYWEGTENPTPEVAGLKSVLGGLLGLPETLTTPTRRAQWTRLLGELPPLPTRQMSGQQAISPSGLLGPKNNHESPELYPVFPYDLYHVGKPDLALADWTYQTRVDQNSFGWGQDAIFAAMLGRSAEAKSAVTYRFGTKHSGSRFPAMWGPNHDWIPDQCHGGATMVALQKMLLLEDGDRLLLFPTWPADWDLKFRVHARGNTTIEGSLENGEITSLEVTPADRYQDLETFLGILPPQTGTWDHWRLNTPGAGGGIHDNGDGDAFEDLLEYALDGDPADPTTPEGLVIATAGGGIVVRYERPTGLTDISYTLESSDDLAHDGWVSEPVVPTVTPSGPDREWVSYEFPSTGDRSFHRLRVTLLTAM